MFLLCLSLLFYDIALLTNLTFALSSLILTIHVLSSSKLLIFGDFLRSIFLFKVVNFLIRIIGLNLACSAAIYYSLKFYIKTFLNIRFKEFYVLKFYLRVKNSRNKISKNQVAI